MNRIIGRTLTAVMLLTSTNVAFSHPSLSHNANEGFIHEASFALIVMTAVIIGIALIKRFHTK